ncbi:mobile mystery protein B [Belliella sp. DSM 107340]|uniref:Mobile mystery protein B n=1 Tax=Belliella calami TaxID=2923436 RepID=A0ABS9UKX7_9BACT|nr:mobile mystery protein B [Belliella calami]MCH7397278.1 mobile mystery protein B [Belliella calami]
MGLDLPNFFGQTPLDEDEKEGLLIPAISSREELDEFEQQNIEDAMQWVFGKSLKVESIFIEKFVCDLHKRMFKHVWSWAGKIRKTDKNLGVSKYQIAVELRILCDDALFWIKNDSFPADEIALRFKHRIVSIHCFSNGNGRHSRLMADIIVNKVFGKPMFSWGSKGLIQNDEVRSRYLKAIKRADIGEYEPLLKFARS